MTDVTVGFFFFASPSDEFESDDDDSFFLFVKEAGGGIAAFLTVGVTEVFSFLLAGLSSSESLLLEEAGFLVGC